MSETFPQYERGAPYWVWVLCCLETALLAMAAVAGAFLGLSAVAAGAPPAALLFIVVLPVSAVLAGWLARAWRRRRPWAWWLLTVFSAVGSTFSALEVLLGGPGVGSLLGLALNALLLLLLTRPSSRAWIQPHVPERQTSAVARPAAR